jgi:hypothetical protein
MRSRNSQVVLALTITWLTLNLAPVVNGFVPTSIHSKRASSALEPKSAVINPGRPRNIIDNRAFRSPKALKTTLSMNPVSAVLGGVKALHGDTNYVLSLVLWLSAFGVALERRTMIGKALSAPLATMALALITANIGLLPFHSPVCK